MTTAAQEKATFETQIDIAEQNRVRLIALLNERLADSIDLYNQTKHAHWNVKGPDFIQLHELFDQVAGHVLEHSDLIAERAVMLGGVAHGTIRQAAKNSSLPEYDLKAADGISHVKALSAQLAKSASAIRHAIGQADGLGDPTTADLFTEISRALDKDLWFVEAHLQAKL
ncbi:MAG TPA: DNA starvation/stationary phase protection protein Dps [Bryobacteraceae bacterium]|nr:DNA starvation/stationary phase protection protein Dps [Bryobacteraceae bacterium]